MWCNLLFLLLLLFPILLIQSLYSKLQLSEAFLLNSANDHINGESPQYFFHLTIFFYFAPLKQYD